MFRIFLHEEFSTSNFKSLDFPIPLIFMEDFIVLINTILKEKTLLETSFPSDVFTQSSSHKLWKLKIWPDFIRPGGRFRHSCVSSLMIILLRVSAPPPALKFCENCHFFHLCFVSKFRVNIVFRSEIIIFLSRLTKLISIKYKKKQIETWKIKNVAIFEKAELFSNLQEILKPVSKATVSKASEAKFGHVITLMTFLRRKRHFPC